MTRRGERTVRTSLLTRRATLILRCTKARLYYPRLMSRPFEKATLADAVGRLRPGMKVLLPAGCGDPTALVAEILRQADRLAPLTLMGGLRLDDYPFGAAAYAGKLRFATWHHSPRLADAQARGDVDFVPIRYFDTVSVFGEGGAWAPDAVLVHCAPPDRAGYLSLGVSVSYALVAARRAPCVIAQVNPRMPRTLGNAFLHRSQIDAWVEAEHALVEYPPTPVGEVERTIARHVAELVPDGATVQVGVGSIPQAVMDALAGKRDLGVHSLLVDHMLPLIESGVITNARKRLHRGRMDVGEIMGTARLFRWAHENPTVNMEPSDVVHDPEVIGSLGDFVSVNSALEVDLLGQVNAESVDGRQITGIGGQFDFVLGASRASGGRSIIALPSTGRQGKVSRIAARLPSGARVTTPRFVADYVITEYGTAALRGQSDAGRARAIARIAHPAFRESLEREAATS
jgi:4-hydroxybutyrate CoA-transferase